jgi:hypothetical protein
MTRTRAIEANPTREWTAHQKAGQVVAWLLDGAQLSTREIASRTGMTWHGARYMLEMLSLTLPIVHVDGTWRWAH